MEDSQTSTPEQKKASEEPRDPSQLGVPAAPKEEKHGLFSGIKGIFKHKENKKVILPDPEAKPKVAEGTAPSQAAQQPPMQQQAQGEKGKEGEGSSGTIAVADDTQPGGSVQNPSDGGTVQSPSDGGADQAPKQGEALPDPEAIEAPAQPAEEEQTPSSQGGTPQPEGVQAAEESSAPQGVPLKEGEAGAADPQETAPAQSAVSEPPKDSILEEIDKLTLNENIINEGREQLNKQIAEVDDKIKKIDEELDELMKL